MRGEIASDLVDPPSSGPVTRLVDHVLGTREGNLVGGGVLVVFSVVAFAIIRAIGPQLVGAQGIGSLWLPLFMAIVSVPTFGGIVLLFAGSGLGFPDGLRYGVLAYAAVGVLVVAFGIPGYVPSGFVASGPFWPFFVLWFHPCVIGVGLWPCPTT